MPDEFTCTRCGQTKPLALFQITNSRRNGTRCKACLTAIREPERAARRAARPPQQRGPNRTEKACSRCGETLPIAKFLWQDHRHWSGRCYDCRRSIKEECRKTPRHIMPTTAERFWSKVDRRGPDECWPWQRYCLPSGYAVFGKGPKANDKIAVHRMAYELAYGPIPEGTEVDHRRHSESACQLGKKCPHRRCCNPAHLEAVSHAVNHARSNVGAGKPHPWTAGKPTARRGRFAAVCQRGHPQDMEAKAQGKRDCKECQRLMRLRRRIEKQVA